VSHRKFRLGLRLLQGAAALAAAPLLAETGASAQQASPAPEGSPLAKEAADSPATVHDTRFVDEIVVTARKTEETLGTVPLAITALTGELITRQNLTGLADFAKITPGLTFNSFNGGGGQAPTIRSMSQTIVSDFENNVGTFYDGVFLSNPAALDIGVIDLARIEVVKGPQSALYGRSSFAGAINYVPREPGARLEGDALLSVGTDEWGEVRAALSVPIIPNRLGIRLSGKLSRFDGTIENLAGGEKLGGYDRKHGFSAVVTARPIDSIRFKYSFLYNTIDLDQSAGYVIGHLPQINHLGVTTNCGDVVPRNPVPVLATIFGFGNTVYCGALPGTGQVYASPLATGLQQEVTLHRLGADVDLGPVLASLVLAHVEQKTGGFTDQSYNPAPFGGTHFLLGGGPIFVRPFVGSTTDKSLEFRIASQWASPLQLLAGVFLYDSDRTRDNDVAIRTLQNRIAEVFQERNVEEKAIFGRLGFELAERLRLSAEGRYTWEDVTFRDFFDLFSSPAIRRDNRFRSDFSYLTPRISIDYQPNDQLFFYASWAEGTKSGGFNATGFVPDQIYGPENNQTYEIGAKTRWFGGRLNLDVALFHIRWTDIQLRRPASDPAANALTSSVVDNVGNAKATGFEVQMSARPIEPLSLRAGLAYSDPKFDEGTLDVSNARYCFPTNNQTCRFVPVGGKSLPRQSAWQGNLGATLTFREALGRFSPYIQADAYYRSRQYVDTSNLQWVPALTLVDAKIGIESERFDLSIWAKNLFDKAYATSANLGVSFYGASITSPVVYVGNRRIIGVTASTKF